MEQLESAEYYMRAFESEQVVRRKLEIECEQAKTALKEMVEKYETTIKIYTALLTQKGLNFDLLDTSKPLAPETKAIIVFPPQPSPQQASPDPEPQKYAPLSEEGF